MLRMVLKWEKFSLAKIVQYSNYNSNSKSLIYNHIDTCTNIPEML